MANTVVMWFICLLSGYLQFTLASVVQQDCRQAGAMRYNVHPNTAKPGRLYKWI